MKLFGREIEGFAQWLVFLVVILLVASGLCGVQWALAAGSGNRLWPIISGFIFFIGILELAAIVISAIGIVVILIAWPVSKLYERFSKPPSDNMQLLFDKDELPSSQENSIADCEDHHD